MATPRREQAAIEVRVDPAIWAVEVERLRPGSPARVAAERERKRLERSGVSLAELIACAAAGTDGTRLARELKVYVPITDAPASQRPFGFVFSLASESGGSHLTLTAFGERHPARGRHSVYERAHKRLHGRYPDQERPAHAESVRAEPTRLPTQGRPAGRGARSAPGRTGPGR